ncbi:transposase [Sphingobium sp. C100]|uniref:IS66-like element accessory protein TnpA n=1 Tax=Sphingobium sp. C100 TaxID=1207055 RepID=UPI0003D65A86|nr:transposase [Sphingobium sp. C100]ETI64612.1 transposase [Sphingobium sp. C100]
MRAEILGQERRRRWTDQQKVQIVGSIGVNGATLADVARRHEVTRQQIYTWRHDLKKRGLLLAAAEPVFLSVGMPTVRGAELAYNVSPGATSTIELRLAQNRTLRFDSDIEAVTLTQLIRLVEAA